MFAQESVMDIQNIVTEQDTETLDAEIAAMTAAFTEEHYLNNDEAEYLEMIAAKSMVLGELYERAKWQAKAQAVPDGFVLVPKELSDEKADIQASLAWGCHLGLFKSQNRDMSTTEIEAFRLKWCRNKARDLQEEYKAMIEAQEQSHECPNP